ncbi:MAG: hypothetical protein NC311_13115 [Muribaculaceae bacterium]|nr:hypothetical protein [Muribaculaceae bacterium]
MKSYNTMHTPESGVAQHESKIAAYIEKGHRRHGEHETLLQVLYTLHCTERHGSGMRGIKHHSKKDFNS